MKKHYVRLIFSILPVVLALSTGAIILLLSGVNPLDAYAALFSGAFGDVTAISRTLEKSTPLIFSALAITLAFKAGLFNIGAQGQFLFGAIAAAFAGWYFKTLPWCLHLPLTILFAMISGGLYSAFQGALKAYTGAHEVITGIMLNYVAMNLTDYLVKGPLMDNSPGNIIPRSPVIGETAKIPEIFQLPVGFFIAIIASFIVLVFIRRTVTGFEIRTVGENMDAARYAGIRVKYTIVIAMLISGCLAGLGGAVETMGVTHRFQPGFNVGLGFEGIMIALLGKLSPIGIIPASLLVGAMKSGAAMMQFSVDVETEIIDLILSVLLFFVASDTVLKWLTNRFTQDKEASITTGEAHAK